MSLYGALNIGVAGLSANSAALSATSSNIANVNTVGYKDETANFETFLNSSGLVGNASAGVAAVIGQDVTAQGLPTQTSSPTDLSISGNGFFVVSTNSSGTGTQEYTRAGSFTPDSSGNLKNAAGLYLQGYALDSAGNIPTNTSQLSLINVTNLAGKAQATSTMTLQANLESSATVDATYTTGDMTSGVATPDFQRTINVYDSQGGVQPVSFSFIKTGANTWAYEAAYAGSAANLSSANPIGTGTVSFNTDGSLANVNGASPASGAFNLTIPWAASTGLASQSVAVNLGTVGSTSGLTQFDTPSSFTGANSRRLALRQRDGRDGCDRRHRDGAILQRPVAGRLQDPAGHLRQLGRPGPGQRRCLCRHQELRRRRHQPRQHGACRFGRLQLAGSLHRGSGNGVHQPDHHPARLQRIGAHRHHRRSDAAGTGTAAFNVT